MPIPLYRCKIVVRSTVKLLGEVKEILSKDKKRERLFRNTVFGPWLDIRFFDNDCPLMHFVLQHQVKVSNISSDSPPLQFKIGDDLLEFGRKEFCLITGFRFGKVCKKKKTNAFRDRVFPEKKTDGIKSVYGSDCLKLVKDPNRFLALSDEDAIRLCLLIVAMLVFMGIEERNCIPNHILSLVEDFDAWNVFPWGEYMWHKFYQRTVNVVERHRPVHLEKLEKNPYYNATYNLYGFAWAFKVCHTFYSVLKFNTIVIYMYPVYKMFVSVFYPLLGFLY
jgi:hypothetical protein